VVEARERLCFLTLKAVAVGLGHIVALHFTPDLLIYSIPLFLKRQCDRTLGGR
jgi:hypothetical protein